MVESIIGGFLVVIIFLLAFAGLIIYSSFAWGYVLYKFYAWFVLPVFTTLPEINIYQAIGLMLVVSLFRNQSFLAVKKEYRDTNSEKWLSLLSPWIILLVGWLIGIISVF